MRAAVLGSPIAHSLSPVLHRAATPRRARPTGRTTPTRSTRRRSGFVGGLGPQWRGLSLTMPLKAAAAELASTVSDVARPRRRGQHAHRLTTAGGRDQHRRLGLVRALSPHSLRGADAALVLGAGATAPPPYWPCRARASRHHRAGPRPRAGPPTSGAGRSTWAPASARLGRSSGAVAHDRRRPASSRPCPGRRRRIAAATVPASHPGVVLDVVYAGGPTPLARAGADGHTVVSGLDMLVHQAAQQFRLFTGGRGPGRGDGRGRPRCPGAGVTTGLGRARRGSPWALVGHVTGRRLARAATASTRTSRPRAGPQLVARACHGRPRRLAAWSVGDLGGWAALADLPALRLADGGPGLVDLDVHRLPVGLVVPTRGGSSGCWPWPRSQPGTVAGSSALVGAAS